MVNIRLYLILSCILSAFSSWTQECTLIGKVVDEERVALPYANVVVYYGDRFASTITDDTGSFDLAFPCDSTVEVTCSYLGYKTEKIIVDLPSMADSIYFQLYPSGINLDSITINAKHIPATIKDDQIIYRADSYRSGKERKLKDLLNNIPGVVVDENNEIFLQGNKVKELIVEGKKFFSGDPSLGAKYIPSEAVDKIIFIEDYHHISFLKDLKEETKLAMEIKLKEGYKKFVFGQIDGGGGHPNKGRAHADMFYYSPDLSLNAVGDISNTHIEPLSFRELTRIKNGSPSDYNFRTQDAEHVLSSRLFSNPIPTLSGFDPRYRVALMGGQYDIGPASNIGGYIVGHQANNSEVWSRIRQDLGGESVLDSDESSAQGQTINTYMGQIEYRTEIEDERDIKISIRYGRDDQNQDASVSTRGTLNTYTRDNNEQHSADRYNASLVWHENFHPRLNTSISLQYSHETFENLDSWMYSGDLLSSILPSDQMDVGELTQTNKGRASDVDFAVRMVRRLDKGIQLKMVGQYKYENFTLENEVSHRFAAGGPSSFNPSGFQIDDKVAITRPNLRVSVANPNGDIEYDIGFSVYNFGFSRKGADRSGVQIFPLVHAEKNIIGFGRLEFDFGDKFSLPTMRQLIAGVEFEDLDRIYEGNPLLDLEREWRASLQFSRKNPLSGFYYGGGLSYSTRRDAILEGVTFENLNQTFRPINPVQDFSEIGLNVTLGSPILRGHYIQAKLRYTSGSSLQIIGEGEREVDHKRIFGMAYFRTNHRSSQPIFVRYIPTYTTNRTQGISSSYSTHSLSISHQLVLLPGMVWKNEGGLFITTNNGLAATGIFPSLTTSIEYQKGDSPWIFSIHGYNLFDNARTRDSFTNDNFLITRETRELPRIFFLNVGYVF